MSEVTSEKILESLKTVIDPDIGANIVDMGLIYNVQINDDGTVGIDMTLTSIGCPYGPQLMGEVHIIVEDLVGKGKVILELVWDPPWSLDFLSDELKLGLGIDL